MPRKLHEKVCQFCLIRYMGDKRSKNCSRSCATKGINSRRVYKTGESHHNFKHCAKQRHIKEYGAWMNMKNRCLMPSCKHYCYYGGRGIKISKIWVNDFNSFLKHVGLAPSKNHSIGRIDNDGHYEPGNVRWETKLQQMSNRRNNRWIEHNGKKMIMADWAKLFGIESTNLLKFIKKRPFEYIYNFYEKKHNPKIYNQ